MLSTTPNLIDVHAHVNFPDFDADRAETVKRALDAGIWMINVGTKEATSSKAVSMAGERPEGVYAIVGLHPIYAAEERFDADFYRRLAASAPKGKVVGIGECGLDYFRNPSADERARQREAFIGQIELALELDLPLMLHIRSGEGEGNDAYRDVLDILRGYKAAHGDRLRGDAHFFAGTVENAREFLSLGFYLSYTGVITFARQYKELIEATPIDRIMCETDCPYVAPVPERGKRNEPSFVASVADKIADIKGLPPAECRKALFENSRRLFGL